MNFYDPTKDTAVINGKQEAYGFKIGDKVEYTNPNGLTFGPHTVIGFCEPEKRTHTYTSIPSGERVTKEIISDRTVYIDSDSPWFPVEPSSLRKIGEGENERKEKQQQKTKRPKHGQDCEFSEDCMWGADGWCNRPRNSKCVLE